MFPRLSVEKHVIVDHSFGLTKDWIAIVLVSDENNTAPFEPLHLVENVPDATSVPELNEIVPPDLKINEPLIRATVVAEKDCTLLGPVRSMTYRCVEFVQVETALQIVVFTHRAPYPRF